MLGGKVGLVIGAITSMWKVVLGIHLNIMSNNGILAKIIEGLIVTIPVSMVSAIVGYLAVEMVKKLRKKWRL